MLQVKYIETLTEMAKGNNKVFVPFQSAGFMGAVGSIKELLSNDTTNALLAQNNSKTVAEVKTTDEEVK